jgi:rubrerythrin
MAEFVNPWAGMAPGRKLTDRELTRALRLSLTAEHEAVHLYEALADASENAVATAVLQDVANEERVHVGEFQLLIKMLYPGESDLLAEGEAEVAEIAEKVSKGPAPAEGREPGEAAAADDP